MHAGSVHPAGQSVFQTKPLPYRYSTVNVFVLCPYSIATVQHYNKLYNTSKSLGLPQVYRKSNQLSLINSTRCSYLNSITRRCCCNEKRCVRTITHVRDGVECVSDETCWVTFVGALSVTARNTVHIARYNPQMKTRRQNILHPRSPSSASSPSSDATSLYFIV